MTRGTTDFDDATLRMRFRAFVLSLLLFCAKASRAAYIESQACLGHDAVPDPRHGGSGPFGLRASLAASPELHDLDRLELTFIGDPTTPMGCEQTQRLNATSSLMVSKMSWSTLMLPAGLAFYKCTHYVEAMHDYDDYDTGLQLAANHDAPHQRPNTREALDNTISHPRAGSHLIPEQYK
ncbi:hypothetical protein E4U58_006935 [Claviceps cyperi]|nr:hypothetical protein E4U58_006935 [Claviceps cyperi]